MTRWDITKPFGFGAKQHFFLALYAYLMYKQKMMDAHTETAIPAKTERIATRVTAEHKSLFTQAATLRGLSLTDFMVNAAYDAAINTLRDSQIVLKLGPEDTAHFVEQVLKPIDDPAKEAPRLYNAVQTLER